MYIKIFTFIIHEEKQTNVKLIAEQISSIEKIKTSKRRTYGELLLESLNDEITGAIREDDQALIKFHGMYQQDDRDRREERAEKKLERLFSFMIRLAFARRFSNGANNG